MKQLKKLLLLLTISLFAINSNSQEINEIYNLSITTAPGTYIDFGHKNYSNDGFNIGINNTFHWNNWFYVGAEAFYFPDLRGLNYFHLAGKFGLNKYFDFGTIDPVLKIHTGFRGGFILRETVAGMPKLIGFEMGVTYFIPNTNLYTGLNWAHDGKEDNKDLNGTSMHTVDSIFFELGIKF